MDCFPGPSSRPVEMKDGSRIGDSGVDGVQGCGVVYYSNRCSLLLNAFSCIFAHANAFSCINSAFCVSCIPRFVAFLCILDPLCLHSLLLHSSFSRCVHSDAFYDLLHFG